MNHIKDQKTNTKEQIEELLRKTNRKGVDCVLEYMERNGFYTRPCHSHHLYSGGMADHSLEVYKVAKRYDTGLPEDSIIISTLLHDFNGVRGNKELKGHGRRSLKLLLKLGLEMTDAEKCAIRNHMRSAKEISHRWRNVLQEPEGKTLHELVLKADRAMPQMAYIADGGFQISRHLVTWKFWRFIMGRDEMPVFDGEVDMRDRAPMVGEVTPEQREKFFAELQKLTGKQYSFATYSQWQTALKQNALRDVGKKYELLYHNDGVVLVEDNPDGGLAATPINGQCGLMWENIGWRLAINE